MVWHIQHAKIWRLIKFHEGRGQSITLAVRAKKGHTLIIIDCILSSVPLELYVVSVCMSTGDIAFQFLMRLIMVVSNTYSISSNCISSVVCRV